MNGLTFGLRCLFKSKGTSGKSLHQIGMLIKQGFLVVVKEYLRLIFVIASVIGVKKQIFLRGFQGHDKNL